MDARNSTLRDLAAQRGTLLCTPLVHADQSLTHQARTAVVAGADLVELRVDLIRDIEAAIAYLQGERPLPCILTIRSQEEGGGWDESEAERIALYERLGLLLPEVIDVELATWRRSANLRQKLRLVCRPTDEPPPAATERPRAELILSYHDWSGTPNDVAAIFDDLAREPASYLKAAFLAADARDALRVMAAARSRADRSRIIPLAMGPNGVAARVLARQSGFFLSFATLDHASASAPGQLTLEQMQQTFYWSQTRPKDAIYGVVGWPVTHSRSPRVHNAAMRALGVAGVYLPLACEPSDHALAELLDQIDRDFPELAGLSVTIPHKQAALAWVLSRGGQADELAQRCGAANTLTRRAGRWHAANTDVTGLLAALDAAAPGRTIRSAAVLGAGGVARAAVVALQQRGVTVTVYARRRDQVEALASEFGCDAAGWDARIDFEGDLIVNATSVGMAPQEAETPLGSSFIHGRQVVLDTVYTPPVTRLLREAGERGAVCVSGLDMFAAQATKQYELWHSTSASQLIHALSYGRS